MVDRSMLTDKEYVFLVSQKILPSQLFDARGRPPTTWGEDAKSQGLMFGLCEPCSAGHRLRNRSGQCIECNTARIAYIRRHSTPGFVYIASSRVGKLHKVGSCYDIEQRQQRLNYDSYAGCNDWKIIAYSRSQSMGTLEFEIHRALTKEKVERTYEKSGSIYTTRESFVNLKKVWQAYRTATTKLDPKDKWQHPNLQLFDC
jgi:hypothetical protein